MKQWTPAEIKELRIQMGMTQAAFAEVFGFTSIYANYLEKGVRMPGKILKRFFDCIEREMIGERRYYGKGNL